MRDTRHGKASDQRGGNDPSAVSGQPETHRDPRQRGGGIDAALGELGESDRAVALGEAYTICADHQWDVDVARCR